MTGMKEGAGDDPFADESPDDSTESDAVPEGEPNAGSDAAISGDSTPDTDDTGVSGNNQQDYPYMLIRDTVKQGRTNDHVYQLRDEYSAQEDVLHDEVEELLGDDVYLTDLREAIVATAEPEAIAAQLRDWGQDIS